MGGSKGYKNNEKGGQQDRKSRRNLAQNASAEREGQWDFYPKGHHSHSDEETMFVL